MLRYSSAKKVVILKEKGSLLVLQAIIELIVNPKGRAKMQLKKYITQTVFVSVITLAAAQASAGGHGVMVGSAEMVPSKTIVENASASDDLAVLVAAVAAAGLVDTLKSDGPFTVLAPTNAAFAKLPAGTVDTLLKPANIEKLKTILTCHVVAAKAMAADVIKMAVDNGGMAEVATVGGCMLTAKYDNKKVTFTDENGNVATVTIADVPQKNGVIHVIDTVLLPKG